MGIFRKPDGTYRHSLGDQERVVAANSENLAKAWSALASHMERIGKSKAKEIDDDWVKDGYAAAFKALPDPTSDLKAWQRQKDADPFDSAALEPIATRLSDTLTDYRDAVAQFPATYLRLHFTGVVDAICGELGDQASQLADPAGGLRDRLGAFAASSKDGIPLPRPPAARVKFDAALKNEAYASFWSRLKTYGSTTLGRIDKPTAAAVSNVFDSGFGASLERLAKATPDGSVRTGAAYLSAEREVASKIELYDVRLKKIQKGLGGLLLADAAVGQLRDGLRAIAASVAKNTDFYVNAGLFSPAKVAAS
ncbi:hypothetical protein GCM10009809_40170 [Isoptericola hypogeus]|uniref:Uncharacterized protein n=1 Tax=Isoptericola hypogeus TaxID=300179 RepID=A0ABP4W0C9_9MICO